MQIMHIATTTTCKTIHLRVSVIRITSPFRRDSLLIAVYPTLSHRLFHLHNISKKKKIYKCLCDITGWINNINEVPVRTI